LLHGKGSPSGESRSRAAASCSRAAATSSHVPSGLGGTASSSLLSLPLLSSPLYRLLPPLSLPAASLLGGVAVGGPGGTAWACWFAGWC
jgi:hypothetical protein